MVVEILLNPLKLLLQLLLPVKSYFLDHPEPVLSLLLLPDQGISALASLDFSRHRVSFPEILDSLIHVCRVSSRSNCFVVPLLSSKSITLQPTIFKFALAQGPVIPHFMVVLGDWVNIIIEPMQLGVIHELKSCFSRQAVIDSEPRLILLLLP